MEISMILLVIGLVFLTAVIFTKRGQLAKRKKSIVIYGSIVLICIISTKFILFPYDLLSLGIGLIVLFLLWKNVPKSIK